MFYKKISDETFSYGDSVVGGGLELHIENKDIYEYPVQGWYWFDTEEEAREFFGLPSKENIILPTGFIPPPGWLPLNVI